MKSVEERISEIRLAKKEKSAPLSGAKVKAPLPGKLTAKERADARLVAMAFSYAS